MNDKMPISIRKPLKHGVHNEVVAVKPSVRENSAW